jgi:hypothetical protein
MTKNGIFNKKIIISKFKFFLIFSKSCDFAGFAMKNRLYLSQNIRQNIHQTSPKYLQTDQKLMKYQVMEYFLVTSPKTKALG